MIIVIYHHSLSFGSQKVVLAFLVKDSQLYYILLYTMLYRIPNGKWIGKFFFNKIKIKLK